MLLVLLGSVFLALCVAPPATLPQISITSPQDGSTLASRDVTISIQVQNFNLVDKLGQANVPGEGHIHYFVDVAPPTTPGQIAVTAPGTYVPTTATSYTWTNLTPGMHNFSVELVNNDHTPLTPAVVKTISVNVAPIAGTPQITIISPTDEETISSSNVTVLVQVQNFNLVDKLGQANVPGEGHIHYFVDVAPPTTPGQIAVTAPGTYVPTSGTSYTWTNLTPGMHNFSVELVNNDHTPILPPVVKTVDVRVTPSGGAPAITIITPQENAILLPGNVIVSVQVQNFNLVDKLGQANVPGEGHIHYFVDVAPPTTPGQIAVTAPGTYVPTSGTSYTWTNISAGRHNFSVELVNNDHTPLSPPVIQMVNVTISTQNPSVDLTNQNSPLAATFTTYPSHTPLTTPQPSLGLAFVAGGFTSPMMMVPANDGSGRMFVVDQTGVVWIVDPDGTVLPDPFLDVRDRMIALSASYDERGLLSMAFHPDYTDNGRLYVFYSAPLRSGAPGDWSCTNRLSEFTILPDDPNRVDMGSEKVILEVDKPYQNHNGGIILFGPNDGYLYLTLGDGGRADDTGIGHTPFIGNGQDLTKMLGKIIRIDVNSPPAGKMYGIPADNPFIGEKNVLPEIFAFGFRNPAYAAFDSGDSHHLFVWVAGQRLFESAYIVLSGGNYGWNIREGTHCFDPNNDFRVSAGTCPTIGYRGEPLIGPVVELGHDVGNTIVGGILYRGNALPDYTGKMFFATWSGNSFVSGDGSLLISTPPSGFDLNALPARAATLTRQGNQMWSTAEIRVANNQDGRINAFVRGIFEGADKEAYLLINQAGGPGIESGTGELWKFVPSTTPDLVNTTTKQPASSASGGGGGY
jgi:glucose/arabinose dehydrogenase